MSHWHPHASQINSWGTLLDQWLLFCLLLKLPSPGVQWERLGNTGYRNTHTYSGPALSDHFLHSDQPIVGLARLNKHCANEKAAGIVIHQQVIPSLTLAQRLWHGKPHRSAWFEQKNTHKAETAVSWTLSVSDRGVLFSPCQLTWTILNPSYQRVGVRGQIVMVRWLSS